MSREEKKKDAGPAEDKSTPEHLDEKFFRWAEGTFRGEEQPTRFYVIQLLGRSGNEEGKSLGAFPVGHLKTENGVDREALGSLCNSIIEEMQDEADAMRQPRRFIVQAHNAKKGGYFCYKIITREPQLGIVTARARAGLGEDGEPDALGGDIMRKRAETVLQDGRFYAELVAQVLGGSLKLEIDRNQQKDQMIAQLFEANMALARQNNEALNNKVERDMLLEEHKFKLSMKQKGFGLLAGMLPDFLKKVTGGKVDVPGGRTAESMAMESIMDEKTGGLTSEQKHHIFGDWTDTGERISPGILTEGQVRIIVDILNERVPVDTLDKLITDGSEEQLTVVQYGQIMDVLKEDADKLVPLVNILKGRKEALDKKKLAANKEQ